MRRYLLSFALLLGAGFAQTPAMPKADLLWPGGAPAALGAEDIDKPSLAPYLAPVGRGTGTAVIVCPGGGYQGLSMDKEGDQIARWLNSLGVSAFVLKYRLGPKYHHPVELGDAQRAIRTVRSKAAEYRLLPDRIGIMGFSAGGQMAPSAGGVPGGRSPACCRTASGSWGSRRADIWPPRRGHASTPGTPPPLTPSTG